MKKIKRIFPGGIKIAQMVGLTNILFLVATGENPDCPSDQVMIWDDKKQQIQYNVQCHEPIKSLSFTNGMYVVGKETSILCMNLENKTQIEIQTCINPKGIHAVSYGQEFCLATTHRQPGYFQLTWFKQAESEFQILQQIEAKAHDNAIVCLELNHKGTILATASEQVSLLLQRKTRGGILRCQDGCLILLGNSHQAF